MLGKIINHNVVVAEIGSGKIEVGGMTLFNPTAQTYLDLGFVELPTANPAAGYHDEWRVATRQVEKQVLTGVEYTSEKVNGQRVTVPHETYDTRTVEEEFIEAVAVQDVPEAQEILHYSKLSIVDSLIDAGIWAQVKAMIQTNSDNWDRFTQAQIFASDYEPFTQMVSAINQAFPQLDAESILERARI